MTVSLTRRVLCAVIALVVAAGAACLAVDVVAVGTGHSPVVWPQRAITQHLEDSRWGDAAIMAVAAATAFVGLLLLSMALSHGRRHLVPLEDGDEHVSTSITRHGLRLMLGDAARHVEGIDACRVRVRGRRVRCRATTPLRDGERVHNLARSALNEQLSALRTARTYKVTVKVRSTKGLP